MKVKLTFIIFSFSVAQMAWAHSDESCQKQASSEPITHLSQWQIYEDISTVKEDFNQLYLDGRRLPHRAYWNGTNYVLPVQSKTLVIGESFYQAISHHIQKALQKSYAEYVFYPDMGHVHVLIPEDSSRNSNLLQRKDLLFLYHTGELFKYKKGSVFDSELVDDPWIQWRYHTRNLLGELDPQKDLHLLYAKDKTFNTVRSIPGYKQAMTVYISSSHKGCFSYNSKDGTKSFDLSLRK